MCKDLRCMGRWLRSSSPTTSGWTGEGIRRVLRKTEIPEIAKIIAVAEVYDTLTASDTYRTRMSSFEAIRELRRVAGTQLDARYVEVLASLLSGEGVDIATPTTRISTPSSTSCDGFARPEAARSQAGPRARLARTGRAEGPPGKTSRHGRAQLQLMLEPAWPRCDRSV